MHSSQYTALAQHLDNEALTVTALHFLPGAMERADGAWVVACNDSRIGHAPAYVLLSFHISSMHTAPRSFSDMHGDQGIEVDELTCGDRNWLRHGAAMRAFADAVDMDSPDMDG